MVIAIAYGAGSAALAALLALILRGRRPEGAGRYAVLACATTLAWTVVCAVDAPSLAALAQVLENARSIAWLFALGALLDVAPRSSGGQGSKFGRALALALGVLAIGNDARFVLAANGAASLDFSQLVVRVTLAVAGILLVENLYRNTGEERRWHVVPLCIGLGAMFGYDLFLYSDALLFRSVDLALFAARGIVIALIVPSLVLTMVRNQEWRIDVHVSRQVVFHTATLIASGGFLLAAAGAAMVLRQLPGNWGGLLQAVTLVGSIVVIVTVLSSGTVRSRIKVLLAQNLFSHRYDYRLEWMKFIDTVSGTDESDALPVRVIRAIANIVDSPGGALWLRGSGGFQLSHEWNMHFGSGQREPVGSVFVTSLKEGTAIRELCDARGRPGAEENSLPEWARRGPAVWLTVPLRHRNELLGFATLAPPRAPIALNWESRDLLLAVGKQAASYLSEERVVRALVDASLLTEYNRRFAFVVHDIKNLAGQLRMTLRNARSHGDDPEFRVDMLATLENSVFRMTELLSKLRPDGTSPREQEPRDPREIISSVADEVGHHRVNVMVEQSDRPAQVAIKSSALRSALTHLITNALEASPEGQPVTVRSRMNSGNFIVEIEDRGPGMDGDFVREQLFRPFRSTKAAGHGLGAFQTRETIREAGGDLEVISSPGQGTIMRILLPCSSKERADTQPVGAVG